MLVGLRTPDIRAFPATPFLVAYQLCKPGYRASLLTTRHAENIADPDTSESNVFASRLRGPGREPVLQPRLSALARCIFHPAFLNTAPQCCQRSFAQRIPKPLTPKPAAACNLPRTCPTPRACKIVRVDPPTTQALRVPHHGAPSQTCQTAFKSKIQHYRY